MKLEITLPSLQKSNTNEEYAFWRRKYLKTEAIRPFIVGGPKNVKGICLAQGFVVQKPD